MVTEIIPADGVHALALTEGTPANVVARATEMAAILRKVIRDQELFVKIGKREHVTVEGWTTLGAMVGVFPYIVWSRPLRTDDGQPLGWEARCVVRQPSGAEIGAAEAQCTREEEHWASRDDYALRSMAQTRATSKAMRLPLAWVMSLAGFDPTPAGEMSRETNRSASAAPVRPPLGQERPNTMILKFSWKCSECGVLLQAGTEAIYDGKSKTVRHPGDCPDPFDVQEATG